MIRKRQTSAQSGFTKILPTALPTPLTVMAAICGGVQLLFGIGTLITVAVAIVYNVHGDTAFPGSQLTAVFLGGALLTFSGGVTLRIALVQGRSYHQLNDRATQPTEPHRPDPDPR